MFLPRFVWPCSSDTDYCRPQQCETQVCSEPACNHRGVEVFFLCENLTDSLDHHTGLWAHATGGGEHQWIKVSVFNAHYSVMILSIFSLLVLAKKGLQGFWRVTLRKWRECRNIKECTSHPRPKSKTSNITFCFVLNVS